MKDTALFKVLRLEEAARSRAAGVSLADVDAADGFIHFSTKDQLAETLALHFSDAEHVVLLEFQSGDLGSALKWEPSRGGALFPHLYAPLPLARATREWTIAADTMGCFSLPEEL